MLHVQTCPVLVESVEYNYGLIYKREGTVLFVNIPKASNE